MARPLLALLLLIGCINAIVATASEKDAVGPDETTGPSSVPGEEDEEAEEELLPPEIVCEDPREVYNECGSACDDRTCEDLRRNDLQCTKQCVEGCFCRNGYVRDKRDRCIPAYRCGKGLSNDVQ